MRINKNHSLLFWLLFCFCLVACAPLKKPEQLLITDYIALTPNQTFGQTFVARYDGLNGIVFYIRPQEAPRGELSLLLLPSPLSQEVLRIGSLKIDPTMETGYYRVSFTPLASSFQEYYYARVSFQGEGELGIGVAPGEAYINGAFYLNDEPQEAQSTFYLTHDPWLASLGVLQEMLTWLLYLGIAAFLYILPGWGLLSSLWPGWNDLNLFEKASLSSGVSLAIYPLLFLWSDLIHLHLGAIYAWLPPTAALVVVLWRNWKKLPQFALRFKIPKITFPRTLEDWATPSMLFVLMLIVATRFWVIRTLDAPMWGDGYQHTLITQLLIDNKGLFESWEPYAELQSLTYHFGFHANAAVFHWVSQLPAHESTLWSGQILNFMAVLVLIPFGRYLKRSHWNTIFILLIAGLLMPVPMRYTNWGRYTQLTGQVILIAFCILLWELMHTAMLPNFKYLIPIWIALGGLALTHYRVLILGLSFTLTTLLLSLRHKSLYRKVSITLWCTLGAVLLCLPWFVPMANSALFKMAERALTLPPEQLSPFNMAVNAIGDIRNYAPLWIWLTSLAGLLLGLYQRSKAVVTITLWWLIVLLLANPNWLHLPGAGALQNFTVFIAAYIPLSLLSAYGGSYLIAWITKKNAPDSGQTHPRQPIHRSMVVGVCFLLFLSSAWGSRGRQLDIQIYQHAQLTRPDIQAFDWVLINTAPDERFLINSFTAWGGNAIVASDGGWWLPYWTKRLTNVPPLTYTFEKEIHPGYRERIYQLSVETLKTGLLDTQTLESLESEGYKYLFIGQRQGVVNSNGVRLDVHQLMNNSYLHLIYQRDRVWIFEILYP